MKSAAMLITGLLLYLSIASELYANAWDPSWSPDGSKIVYTCDYGGSTNIWIANADGSNPTQLTDHLHTDWDPDWSSDGSKIVFSHDRDGDMSVMNVWTINVDGTALTQITNGTSGWETEAVWSPDMNKIAFDGLNIMNADGSGQVPLTSGIQPSFSPGGSQLVYSDGGHIRLVNTDGSSPIQLTNDPVQDWHPDYSHDGTKIVFTSNRNDSDGIWTMDADGSNFFRVADSSSTGEPQWSPDDSKIIFEGPDGKNIWVVNADGSGLSMIPTPSDVEFHVSVINVHQEDGSFAAKYIFGIHNFNGSLPGDILSVTVETPQTGTVFPLTWDSGENHFSRIEAGQPELGVFTFTATTMVGQLVATDYQYVIHSIPVPATAAMSPTQNSLVDGKTPIFSWESVDLAGVPLYHFVEVLDKSKNDLGKSDLSMGMTGVTVPEGDLEPGDYKWRVVVADSNDVGPIQNMAVSEWLDFTVPETPKAHSALPAIHPNDWNGLSWTGGNAFACSVKVTDLDGVAYDGSSHVVTVTAPDGATFPDGTQVRTVDFDSPSGPTSGYYWLYVGGGLPASGEYTFTVTDPEGLQTTFVEQVDIHPLNGPDEDSLTPSNMNEYITATFDNVYVNGQLYEDFNINDISELDSDKWRWVSESQIVGNQLVVNLENSVGRAHGGVSFADVEPITSVQADISVNSFSDGTKKGARIAGSFFNDGSNADFWVVLWNDGTKVCYTLSRQWLNHQGAYQWETIQSKTLVTAGVKDIVTMGIVWNEAAKTLSFAANNKTQSLTGSDTYVHTGPVFPPIEKELALQTRINLITSTTPTFSWAPVADANRYRVRVYTQDKRTVWKGYTGAETTYTVPPGVLEPGGYYRYRVEAWDMPSPLGIDNYSRAPVDSDYYRFYTEEEISNAPAIAFAGAGAYTNTSDSGVVPVFWVRIDDRQGVPGNIASVTVRFPSGHEESLTLDHTESSSRGYYTGESNQPVETGMYTFTVTDNDGHTATITDDLVNDPISATDNLTTAVRSKEILVSWDPVPGAIFYRIDIFNTTDELVLRIPVQAANGSSYAIPRGLLAEGQTFRYQVNSYREWFSQITGSDAQGNMDNRSQAPSQTGPFPTFELTADSDNDGLSDFAENRPGACTNADQADTDADGIIDGDEDSSHDGSRDPDETDPCNEDSDDDGLQDGEEKAYWGDDWDADIDEDGMINILDDDSDGDGFTDGFEVRKGSDPADPDDVPRLGMPWVPFLLLGD